MKVMLRFNMPNSLSDLRAANRGHRPAGYKNGSNTPYYCDKFGRELKPHLDYLLEHPDEEVSFSCKEMKTKQVTLYNRIYQAWRWLEDKDIKGPAYKELKARMSLRKWPGEVRISRIKSTANALVGRSVTSDQLSSEEGIAGERAAMYLTWKQELLNFVEDSPEGELFEMTVNLNPDDFSWLRDYLTGVNSIIAILHLSPRKIKLVKNTALAAKLKNET